MQLSLDAAMGHTFSVGEFSQLLTDAIAHVFPHDVWVQGEVRGITRAQSGHVYFDLVDPATQPGKSADAVLPVVLFESTKRAVNNQIKNSGGGMRIDDGVAVRIKGIPNYYAPAGRISLRMSGIDPAYTLGQLTASRDRLLHQLAEDGLIERNARLVFPPLPLRIGLVTARGSAAAADFLEELRGSGVAFEVVLAPTPVQGAGAAHQIAGAIRACARHDVDVIAVVRGGGARTDLAVFDDEAVARTIAACPMPVLTGIGHEIDSAVADMVAHESLKTPTACAARIVGAVAEQERRLADCQGSLERRAREQLEDHARRVDTAATRVRQTSSTQLETADQRQVRAAHRVRELTSVRLDRATSLLDRHQAATALHTRHRLRESARTVATLEERLAQKGRQRLLDAQTQVDRAQERLRLLDPARNLARGWSITTTADGRLVRSSDDVGPGDQLVTRTHDGAVNSTVNPDEFPASVGSDDNERGTP